MVSVQATWVNPTEKEMPFPYYLNSRLMPALNLYNSWAICW
jgi:hypothetical protein